MIKTSNSITRRRAVMVRNDQERERRPSYNVENGWHALRSDFASLNQLKSSCGFTLDALLRGLCHGGTWGGTYQWPGCDHHTSYYKQNGRTALVLAEPYRAHEVDALRAYAADKGLAFHMPTNPTASFWFPGFTYLVALTRPEFGEVKWLPDQLSFLSV